MFSIEAIMSTNLITIPPSATLAEARALMHDNRIHHVPVMDGEHLVGLVTLTNVLAATDSFLRDDQSRIHANEIGIRDAMVTYVAAVGIITDTDFVAVAINLLELLEETEPDDEDFDDLDVA